MAPTKIMVILLHSWKISTITTDVNATYIIEKSPLIHGKSKYDDKPQAMDKNHLPDEIIFWSVYWFDSPSQFNNTCVYLYRCVIKPKAIVDTNAIIHSI